MLAGCSSSTLLSPRHRLRSEAAASAAQFQACHFPSMNTQRLDLPSCSFPRKDTPSSRSSSQQQQQQQQQPIIRPVGLSVEIPKTVGCSLKQNIRLPPSATTAQPALFQGRRDVDVDEEDEFWGKGKKSLKRFAEPGWIGDDDEDYCINKAKRKRGSSNVVNSIEEEEEEEEEGGGGHSLSLGQLGSGNFWFQPSFEVPCSVPFSLSCSGDEERACFVPSEVISMPLPPLSNNPWVDSVVTEITELGDKNIVDTTSQGRRPPVKEASGSSTSSESNHSLGHRVNDENIPQHVGTGNGSGSGNPYPYEGALVEAAKEEEDNNHEEHQGLELVSYLMACVEAIGSKNIIAINHFIAKLGDLASPKGESPITRLIAYFTEALALRLTRLWPHIFHITSITTPRELDHDDNNGTALRLLNQVTAVPKFIHFTSNEILLRAFEGKDRIHIIDFDIKQGLQWPSLFQSLASRRNPPTHVRITGIGESKQDLNETGDRLAGFAEALSLPFEFHPVVDRLEDVRLWMLHVKERECVAVNCIFQLHKTLYDANGGALRDLLGIIRSTNPTIVVMGEQESENNEPSLETRVCNSLKYYSAIFDSIDSSSLRFDNPVRIKIEEMFAREIRNILACEGSDRYERHESFETWRKLLEGGGGFRCIGVGERELLQSRMLLKMYSCNNHYRVEKQGEDGGGGAGAAALTLCWEDQPLYTVSAWAPIDFAGSSSTFSQPS